ncbi:EscU/YscU/HrcU family type III secretion system export apparatus switch protein [Escherichia albertii]|uniref:EscU/YscU/HrcU family type III secretion system export apparatus switch protein n=1 Tax=Escherichia albertii TaxID=208962 RepID=UPI0010F864F2|nr:EscU/YscU/HrcU family type III secretion system export apparatus switch protein [Escherichia albertii]
MAEEKTEHPTNKKKNDSAKKGQMFLSRDFVGLITLLAVSAMVWGNIDASELTFYFELFVNNGFNLALGEYVRLVTLTAFKIIAGVVAVSILTSVFITLIQTRFKMASEAVRIDFNQLNPVNGLKEIFSMRNLKDGIKALLYLAMAIIGFAIFIIKYHARLFTIPSSGLTHLVDIWRSLMPMLFYYMLMPFLIIIAFDAMIEFFLYIKDLMMTKQEVKQEYKNNEGDPHIKSARKQLHRELLSEQTKANIKTSKMILANPTHIALGIYFNPQIIGVPFFSVVEKNARALAVIAYAEKHNVPIIRNISLARRIFKTAKIYTFVDSDSVDEIMQLIEWLEQVNEAWKNDIQIYNAENPDDILQIEDNEAEIISADGNESTPDQERRNDET